MFDIIKAERISRSLATQKSLEKKRARLKRKGKSKAFIDYKINTAYKRIEYKVYLKHKFSIFDELERIISKEVEIRNNNMLEHYVDTWRA